MEMIDSGSGRGAARAKDAQGTPTQSHISPSILVYEDEPRKIMQVQSSAGSAPGERAAERPRLPP